MDTKGPLAANSREGLLEKLERSYQRLAADGDRLGTPTTAIKKLGTLKAIIDVVKGQGPGPAAEEPAPVQTSPGHPETVTIPWHDVEALFAFYEDAIDTIQLARYSVRFGKPLETEPAYPRGREVVLALLRRVLDELRPKSG